MTKNQKKIIELLFKYPASIYGIQGQSTMKLGPIFTTRSMLEKMKGNGLIIMGVHPAQPGKNTYIPNINNDEVKAVLRI